MATPLETMSTASVPNRTGALRILWCTLLTAGVVLALMSIGHDAGAQGFIPPGIGIRLLEVPTDLAADPRAQLYVIDHVAPGTTISRDFEIANGDPEPFDVEMYGVAASVEDNAFLGDEGRGQNELSSWITVEPNEVTLEPGQRFTSNLRIEVPADAPPGEQFAVVFAERLPEENEEGFAFSQRVGVRVYLSVGEGNAPPSDFEITSFTATRSDAGEPGLVATVENTGGRALDFQGEVLLEDGPGGLVAGPFDVELGTTLLPGRTTEVELLLDPELPDGPWLATLNVRSGLIEKEAVATITFPESGETNVIEIEPVEVGLSTTTMAAGAAAIGGLLVIPLWLVGRRRNEEDEEDEADASDDDEASDDAENPEDSEDSDGSEDSGDREPPHKSGSVQEPAPAPTPVVATFRPPTAPAFPPPVVSATPARDRKMPATPPPPPGASAPVPPPVPPPVVPTPTGL